MYVVSQADTRCGDIRRYRTPRGVQNETIVYQFLELIMTIKQIFHFSHISTTIQFVKITQH